MKLSPDTQQVLSFLEEITGGNLRKKSDIGTILEIGASTNRPGLVTDIIFQGKILWNLYKTLNRQSGSEHNPEFIRQELAKSLVELRIKLQELVTNSDDHIKLRFSEVYFVETSGAGLNLVDLAHDLSEIKDLQSKIRDMKRRGNSKNTK